VVDTLRRPAAAESEAGGGQTAQALADELAALVWARREHWAAPSFSVERAIAEAEAAGAFPAILADGGDNTGGGAPGDGTAILRRFLRSEEPWPCCVPYIVGPSSAAAAHATGVGAVLEIGVSHQLNCISHSTEPLAYFLLVAHRKSTQAHRAAQVS
jgi:microcystin degradation protein MlrC